MNKKIYVWDVSYELSSYTGGNVTKEQRRDTVVTEGSSINDVGAVLLEWHKKFNAVVILGGTFNLAFSSLSVDGDEDAE